MPAVERWEGKKVGKLEGEKVGRWGRGLFAEVTLKGCDAFGQCFVVFSEVL
jgi:hypothetical protein